jgi:brefeldin A-inhibited guanine nucleotide-exchange protein
MATEAPAGKAHTKLERVVSPALEKVIKNSSWRKHSKLTQEAKAAIDKLAANDLEAAASEFESPLYEDNGLCYSLANAELILQPLIGACETTYPKIVEPALDCLQKLIAHGHLRGDMDTLTPDNKLLLEVQFFFFPVFELT